MSTGITSVDTVTPSSVVTVQYLPSWGSHILRKKCLACRAAAAHLAWPSAIYSLENIEYRSMLCSVDLYKRLHWPLTSPPLAQVAALPLAAPFSHPSYPPVNPPSTPALPSRFSAAFRVTQLPSASAPLRYCASLVTSHISRSASPAHATFPVFVLTWVSSSNHWVWPASYHPGILTVFARLFGSQPGGNEISPP